MLKSQQQLEKICDSIFNHKNFNNKWIKKNSDDYNKSIWFETKLKGVPAHVIVHINIRDKNKAVAYFSVGEYRIDHNFCFRKEITFSIWKKNSFENDFFKRLGLSELEAHIENIVSHRKEIKKENDILYHKIEAFKRGLPFKTDLNDHRLSYYDENKKGDSISVEILRVYSDSPTLTISADSDLLIQLSSIIGQIINK
ncbi:hypothetical protein H3S74_12385 [Gilliamella sp. W8126]|uniref:hypothetical protein n=1 Tax=Gilliamella sp. W8126 TaxID=2750946 RepID=UPI0018DE4EBE|nr:hypothetical protein [Gilliamella sp. W8126]MBI0007026.1 hypothetical protein [Gilliamella sp. W8126]